MLHVSLEHFHHPFPFSDGGKETAELLILQIQLMFIGTPTPKERFRDVSTHVIQSCRYTMISRHADTRRIMKIHTQAHTQTQIDMWCNGCDIDPEYSRIYADRSQAMVSCSAGYVVEIFGNLPMVEFNWFPNHNTGFPV